MASIATLVYHRITMDNIMNLTFLRHFKSFHSWFLGLVRSASVIVTLDGRGMILQVVSAKKEFGFYNKVGPP